MPRQPKDMPGLLKFCLEATRWRCSLKLGEDNVWQTGLGNCLSGSSCSALSQLHINFPRSEDAPAQDPAANLEAMDPERKAWLEVDYKSIQPGWR